MNTELDQNSSFKSNVNKFTSDVTTALNNISDALKSINKRLDKLENQFSESNDTKSNDTEVELIINETRSKNIEECLKCMDWKKIHNTMTFLNWKWARLGGVPTINELKRTAKEFLERCYNSMDEYNNKNKNLEPSPYAMYSGGIKVRTFPDDDCELYFILSDYSTCE